MSFFRGDASDFYKVAGDLSVIGAAAVPALCGVMAEAGRSFATEWRKNAEETSGEHGRHYPKSIDSELVFDLSGVSVDVGPNKAKKQGSMGRGFEFGSENQPPHLDGLRALGLIAPRADRMVDAAIGHLFG